MEWMILPLKRYFDFSGRSRRKEYWMFLLFTIIGNVVLSLIDGALGLTVGDETSTSSTGVLSGIFGLLTFIPSVSVGVRRLHDTGRTGWWILLPVALAIGGAILGGVLGGAAGGSGLAGLGALMIGIVLGVVIGGLVLLAFYCTDGTRGPNRFGDDPKGPVLHNVAEVFR